MNLILELRHRAGLTQALFGRLAGISPASISAYENGHTSPTLEMVERLATAAGLEVVVSIRSRQLIDESRRVMPGPAPAMVEAETDSTSNASGGDLNDRDGVFEVVVEHL